MKKATIQDIAREANVSKATVSRVLNQTAVVADVKKTAVLDAVKKLGFQPSVVARSLSRGKSMTIGVLTQLIGSPFYDTIAQGVISGLQDTGYSPIFADGRLQHSKEVEAIKALTNQRVDGLVLIGGGVCAEELSEHCGYLPTVIAARQLPGLCCVSMDNIDGGYQATRHLIAHGHTRIAMIQGQPQQPDAIERFKGYQQALKEVNLPVDQALVIEGDFSAESGIQGIETLLQQKTEFTAIFAANDMTAFGARLALHQHGILVPEQVSVIGYDDQMEAAYSIPPLTTIRQPAVEMGELASQSVLMLIDDQRVKSVAMKGRLIVRSSVDRCR